MTQKRILIAEDDPHIRQGLIDVLESEGYVVIAVADGDAAVAAYAHGKIDLALLDIMMPERSGYDVCREIRRLDSNTPVIMLTARGEEIDKVVGLELGADDYVTKPFGVRELLARISAVLRRCENAARTAPEAGATPFRFAAVEIHPREMVCVRVDERVPVSARELKLIDAFRELPGEVLSRDELLNRVWGVHYFGTTRTLDQHVAQLRKKVERDSANPVHLLTVHGVGYRYRP